MFFFVFPFCPTEMIGCYIDDKILNDNFVVVKSRALGYQVESFKTKQHCIDQCGDKGYLYAGFQNGDLCFCGDKYDKYGRADDSECNIKCRSPEKTVEFTDDEFEACGGRWRNAVYAGKQTIAFVKLKDMYSSCVEVTVPIKDICVYLHPGVFKNCFTSARWI